MFTSSKPCLDSSRVSSWTCRATGVLGFVNPLRQQFYAAADLTESIRGSVRILYCSAILLSYYRNRSYPIVEIRIRRLSFFCVFLFRIHVFVCIPRPSYYLHDIVVCDVIREMVNRLSRLGCLGHSSVEIYRLPQFYSHGTKYSYRIRIYIYIIYE